MRAIPRHWFSWDFVVMDGDKRVADIDLSWWRERGQFTIEGQSYDVYREGLLSGAFILETDGREVVRAEKPSAFFRSFIVHHAGNQYTLAAQSAFLRVFALLDGDREIGSLRPEGVFTRRMRVDLPQHLPIPVQVFLVWLTIILWKRASDAAAAS